MLEDDGYHLTPEGGKLLADLIAMAVTQHQTQKPLQPTSINQSINQSIFISNCIYYIVT